MHTAVPLYLNLPCDEHDFELIYVIETIRVKSAELVRTSLRVQ